MRSKYWLVDFGRDDDGYGGSVVDQRVVKTHSLVEEMNLRLLARTQGWELRVVTEAKALRYIASREFDTAVFG